jgi:hypothetical protein
MLPLGKIGRVLKAPGFLQGVSEIEGNSSFETFARFAMIPSPCGDTDHGAATPAELRILRQGPAAAFNEGAHLQLRVHVLHGLRRETR